MEMTQSEKDEALRLECLRIALQSCGWNKAIESAKKFYEFVKEGLPNGDSTTRK
jgi:hypothetical protein